MQLLDSWSNNLTEQQKNQLLKDNFEKIQQAINFMGMSLIFSSKFRVAQTINSTSYVQLSAFNGRFVSSGGLIMVFANYPVVFNTTTESVYVQMNIDGLEKNVVVGRIQSLGNVKTQLYNFYFENMNAGNHTISFNAKSDISVNTTIGQTDSDSVIYILEFRQG